MIAPFVAGCSPPAAKHQSRPVPPSGLSKVQLEKIQRNYKVVLDVQGHQIDIGTFGVRREEQISQIDDVLHKALGNDFTNYTIDFTVD